MPAPKDVLALVEKFDRHRESYESAGYNETQLRREFLDPMFAALGWDVQNVDGAAEAYKDVIHEDAIRVGEFTKAPDYGFRIGGTRKFFVEAKKPSKRLKDDAEAAFQLRRYAWSAKLPLSILTDFQEFAVYDTRLKPSPKDKASVGRVLYVTYAEYAEKWDEIAAIFSQDAVRQGAFDKFAEGKRPRRGTTAVDEAFLEEIEGWREALAKNIAVRNSKRDVCEINFAVQRIIDRIIFLRIAEDRGIEPYGRLQGLLNGRNVYARLMELFEQADDRYNSGLFHFKEERGRAERPDELTPELKVDDEVLKDIIEDLYPPKSPYAFSVISADILGAVYEQFLGKVIRLTAGHHVKVEEKPEVRKAGGVYYTPTYIVEYIVKQTVGKLLEGRTPKQAAELKVLDPACGSGSFLIGAYQRLLDWHRDWYVNDGVEKHRKVLYQGMGGDWRLTTKERTRILLNNIYGVDIDQQAVEVTKLSLLLKVLEGGSPDALQREFWGAHERVLPDLGESIKCGNSLIEQDFFLDKLDLLEAAERDRVNAFDWRAGFPSVLGDGRAGFDCVIGNPPYGADVGGPEAEYLAAKFGGTSKDVDTYGLFMEQGLNLCRGGGYVSMIVPTGWYTGPKFSKLRRLVASWADPEAFVNLPYDVFEAWVDTSVFVLRKRTQFVPWPRTAKSAVRLRTFPKRHRIAAAQEIEEQNRLGEFTTWFEHGRDEFLTYADQGTVDLISKLQARGKPLGLFADVQRGVTPFKLSDSATHRTSRRAFDGTVRRYTFDPGPVRFIRLDDTIAEPKPERYFLGPRLLLRELISRQFQLQAVMVVENFVTNKSMQSILKREDGPSLEYLLGILNSRLMSWYFLHRSQVGQRDDFPKIVLKETRELPIVLPERVSAGSASNAARLEKLVRDMLAQQARLRAGKEHEREGLERQIVALDQEIDQVVHRLYGLTAAEIRIVEEATE